MQIVGCVFVFRCVLAGVDVVVCLGSLPHDCRFGDPTLILALVGEQNRLSVPVRKQSKKGKREAKREGRGRRW